MTIEIVFVALNNIGQVSHLPDKQIPALLERIRKLRLIVKSTHPHAQCIFSWHENSIRGLDEPSCRAVGISKFCKDYLKQEILNLTQNDPDLHIIAGVTVDTPLKDADELKKIRDLYPLHYDIRDREKAGGYVPKYTWHEESCLRLLEQPFSLEQKKRVISCYYAHRNRYIRHDKRAPFIESYDPLIIWQPPKKKHINPLITIPDSRTDEKILCQIAICRALKFSKIRSPILIVMSDYLGPIDASDADLAEVVFHIDSHYSHLYFTESFSHNYRVTLYENNISKPSTELREIPPRFLKGNQEARNSFVDATTKTALHTFFSRLDKDRTSNGKKLHDKEAVIQKIFEFANLRRC